jgi:endonuclease/exonuclease/phosphatase family metal-dependent hydrolase
MTIRPQRRRLCSILAALCCLVVAARAAPVKVVAWNLQWFPGRVPEATPAVALEHIREVRLALSLLKPDILIVEELKDPDALRSAVKDLNGLKVQAVSDFPGRPQQVAICSRFPVRRSGWGEWGPAVVVPPRGFAYAEIEVASNVVVQVQALHWKSNRGVGPINMILRTASALQDEVLAEALTPPPGTRCGSLLAGDLNTSLDAEEMVPDPSLRYLIGRGWWWPFGHLAPKDRMTWQGYKNTPSIQFDHFLTRGLGKPVAKVGKTGRTSDHQPILMTIRTEDVGAAPMAKQASR